MFYAPLQMDIIRTNAAFSAYFMPLEEYFLSTQPQFRVAVAGQLLSEYSKSCPYFMLNIER